MKYRIRETFSGPVSLFHLEQSPDNKDKWVSVPCAPSGFYALIQAKAWLDSLTKAPKQDIIHQYP